MIGLVESYFGNWVGNYKECSTPAFTQHCFEAGVVTKKIKMENNETQTTEESREETTKIEWLWAISLTGVLVAWSAWGITNFPYRTPTVELMQCFTDGGEGPYTEDCGEMEVRCYTNITKNSRDRVDCPFYENII